MITVEKNGIVTDVLEIFKEKYLNNGWKIIEKPKKEIKDEAEKIIAKSIDNKKASLNRKKDLTTDAESEAEAIVSTELKAKENTNFTDGLIKE